MATLDSLLAACTTPKETLTQLPPLDASGRTRLT